MCGYLEDYVEVTAKVQKSQAKDYEKVLKVWRLFCLRWFRKGADTARVDCQRSPSGGAPFLSECRWSFGMV